MNNSDSNLDEEYSKYEPKEPDQIIEHAFNWNLSCDVSLLKFMEKFAMDTIAKCNDINTKIGQINESVTDTQLFLNKLSDKFQKLFDTKIVEHKSINNSINENHEPELESETVEIKDQDFNKLESHQFINSCIELIDEYYEKVPFSKSDNNFANVDDSDADNFVLRPVNKFIERKLPALAGTSDWLNKWHLGTASSSESESEDMTIDDLKSDTVSQQTNHSSSGSIEKILSRNASLETLSSTIEENHTKNEEKTTKMNFLQELQSKLTKKSSTNYNPVSIFSEEPPDLNQITKTTNIPKTNDDNNDYTHSKSFKHTDDNKLSFFNDKPPELPKTFKGNNIKIKNYSMEVDNEPKLLTCLTKNRVRNNGRRLPSRKMLTKSLIVTKMKASESINIPKSKTCDETIMKYTMDKEINNSKDKFQNDDLDEIFQSVNRKFSNLFNDINTRSDKFEDLFRSRSPNNDQKTEHKNRDKFEDPLGFLD